MSERVDKFCGGLKEKLNAVEGRLAHVKASLASAASAGQGVAIPLPLSMKRSTLYSPSPPMHAAELSAPYQRRSTASAGFPCGVKSESPVPPAVASARQSHQNTPSHHGSWAKTRKRASYAFAWHAISWSSSHALSSIGS